MFKLGVPNGSLNGPTMEILGGAGFSWPKISGRKFKFDFADNPFLTEGIMFRPQSMPEAVKEGFIDCGICGRDCLVESGLGRYLREVCVLPYAKNSQAPVRIAVFGKRKKFLDKKGIKVFSEYPRITRQFFKEAIIVPSPGSTESMVAYGDYDFGVGVVESGSSLRDNGLAIVKVLLESPVVLIARRFEKILSGSKENKAIDSFGKMLNGAFLSLNFKLLKFNVLSPLDLPKIEKEKFWLERLTLNRLDGGGFAAEALIKKDLAVEIIARLSLAGASGVILQDISFFL